MKKPNPVTISIGCNPPHEKEVAQGRVTLEIAGHVLEAELDETGKAVVLVPWLPPGLYEIIAVYHQQGNHTGCKRAALYEVV